MRKSEKYSVAIFLAVALFAGTIAGPSAPALVDAQATEEKKDYKEKDRNYDKDYRHDDNKGYGEEKKYGYDGGDKYGKDREDKYGHEDQYSKYGGDRHDDYGKDRHDDYGKDREDKYGHDDKSVKYIKCNNVNINGKDGNHDGNDKWPRNGGGNEWPRNGGGNEWPRNGGGNEWFGNGGGNEWPRNGGGEHDSFTKQHFPGFIKQTDKDVVVICIFNNDKKDKEPKTPEEKCDACIEELPGLSPGENPRQPNGTGLERDFIEFLIDDLSPPGDPLSPQEAIAEFCDMLLSGDITEAELMDIIDMAIPPGAPSNPFEELFECLSELIPSGPPRF